MDPRPSRNVDVGAFLMARLDLLIYHCFFSKINQPTSNRRLLKVGRLIILEKSRKKNETGWCRVWSSHLLLSESLEQASVVEIKRLFT